MPGTQPSLPTVEMPYEADRWPLGVARLSNGIETPYPGCH